MKKTLEYVAEKRTIRIMLCTILFVVMSIQFSSSFLYSLDDYYLEDIYDLNWYNIGYNWYGYGRLGEAILGQIIYWLNLSPFNGIGAFLLWGIAVALFADYIVERWKIQENGFKFLCMLLIVFNPFFVELYFYKNILAFSAIAVISIRQGLICMDSFWEKKKVRYLFESFLFIYVSLSIYQIFFPIIFMLYAVALLLEKKRDERIKNTILSFGIMIGFLIIYYVSLKIMFICKPTNIVYPGTDLKQLFRNVFLNENGYWEWMAFFAKTFLFKDNMVSSGILNNLLLIVFNLGLFIYMGYELVKNKFRHLCKTLGVAVAFLIVEGLGVLSCFGFSLTSILDTSSRSFTGWGIYSAGILCLISEYLKTYDFTKLYDVYKKAVLLLMSITVVCNACRLNRCALDINKMNQNEGYLINRIVARLENYESFDPEFTRIYVYGYADLAVGYDKYLACFNRPAVGGFSTIGAFRQVTGYNFQSFDAEGCSRALEYIQTMPTWPEKDCILETEDGFIIKLGD